MKKEKKKGFITFEAKNIEISTSENKEKEMPEMAPLKSEFKLSFFFLHLNNKRGKLFQKPPNKAKKLAKRKVGMENSL